MAVWIFGIRLPIIFLARGESIVVRIRIDRLRVKGEHAILLFPFIRDSIVVVIHDDKFFHRLRRTAHRECAIGCGIGDGTGTVHARNPQFGGEQGQRPRFRLEGRRQGSQRILENGLVRRWSGLEFGFQEA